MGLRGPSPKKKVKIEWSSNFAYAIGLIASDGCLSKDGRHITFVSKEIEQINNFLKALNIENYVGKGFNGNKTSRTWRIQFSDVYFYNFLVSIGLTPAKSLTIKEVAVPHELYFDFLRGVFDGDGYSYSYFDNRWKSSFMFYICFCSASFNFIYWIRKIVEDLIHIKGHITIAEKGENKYYQLKYAKSEAVILSRHIYSRENSIIYLKRKRLKVEQALCIMERPQKERVLTKISAGDETVDMQP